MLRVLDACLARDASHDVHEEVMTTRLTPEERDVLEWCREKARDTADRLRGGDEGAAEAIEVVSVLDKLLAQNGESDLVAAFIDTHAARLANTSGNGSWEHLNGEERDEWASEVYHVLNNLTADEDGRVHDARPEVTRRSSSRVVRELTDEYAADLAARYGDQFAVTFPSLVLRLGSEEPRRQARAIISFLVDELRGTNPPSGMTCSRPPEPLPTTHAFPDDFSVETIARYVLTCANSHDPEARLIGNCRAVDIARLCRTVVATPLTVSKALDDPRVRAGTHVVEFIEKEGEFTFSWQVRVHNGGLSFRRTAHDQPGKFWAWALGGISLAQLEALATVVESSP